MKRKGFTLVELLAMLTVLGIIMIIAVPNITGMLAQQKLTVIKQDATKMMDTLKVKIATNEEIKKPSNNKCIVFTLKSLNTSDDIKNGPNGKPYTKYSSYIIMKRVNTQYIYYVRIVEKDTFYGINKVNYQDLLKDDADKNIKALTSSDYSIDQSEISIMDQPNMTEEQIAAGETQMVNLVRSSASSLCSGGIEAIYK